MKIYIPQHLRKLELIDNFARLIEEYSELQEIENDPFENYRISLKLDPVRKFLNMCLPKEPFETVQYLSSMFYSVKGTVKVFEYMRRYLGLKFSGPIKWTKRRIELTIVDLDVPDGALFLETMRDFLSALLYFEELHADLGRVNLTIEKTIENSIGYGRQVYQIINPEIKTL